MKKSYVPHYVPQAITSYPTQERVIKLEGDCHLTQGVLEGQSKPRLQL